MGAARRHLGGEKVAQLLEGGDVLGGAALDGLVGRDREDHLAPDVGMIALGQAHGAEQQPDGDLARKIVDEFERLAGANAIQRTVGDLDRRRDKVLDVLAGERGLAQRAQAVMPRRIGGAERRAGAAGQFVDHVALGGREGLPIARGG